MRAAVGGIILGSCSKGLLVGLITGLVARKTGSTGRGVVVGVLAALALTIPIAIMNVRHYDNPSYYWKIILPGALTGLFVGYATVRYGRAPRPAIR